jgi:hypothetical protein
VSSSKLSMFYVENGIETEWYIVCEMKLIYKLVNPHNQYHDSRVLFPLDWEVKMDSRG